MNVNVIYNSIEVKSNLCTVRPDAPTARFFFWGGGGEGGFQWYCCQICITLWCRTQYTERKQRKIKVPIYWLLYPRDLFTPIKNFTAYLVTILNVLNKVFGLENMSETFWVFLKVHKWYYLQAEKTLNFSTYSTNEGTLTLKEGECILFFLS